MNRRPSYDDLQAGAQRCVCAICGRAFYTTHPTEPWYCVTHRSVNAGAEGPAMPVRQDQSNRLNEMLAADQRYREAAEMLQSAVERALPVGARVAVTIGRARITGRVTGYAFRPAPEVWIRNDDTGKERKFDPTYSRHDLCVLEPPQSLSGVVIALRHPSCP